MASSPAVPPEVLALIVSLAELETLKSLRLTSRMLCHFASKDLFRVVTLYDTEESCHGFKSIISHPQLKYHVAKVYLKTVENGGYRDNEEELDPPEKWQNMLTILPELPNLESVALCFDKRCDHNLDWGIVPQAELYRETVMKWLFAGLASLRRPLKELAIQHHQNTAPVGDVLNQISQVASNLTSLRLNVTHEEDEASPENDIEMNEPHQFFTRILPEIWLKPSMGSLKKLSLYSTLFCGFYPHVNLEGVHFPNLKSLTFGNFSFFEDKQLDWILLHSATLQELYLDDCHILFYITMFDEQSSRCPIPDMQPYLHRPGYLVYSYPRRWYDYFAAIQTGLPHLRVFGIGFNEAWDEVSGLPFETEQNIMPALKNDRYMAFDGGIGPYQFIADMEEEHGPEARRPICNDQDRDALKALYQKIGMQVDCGRVHLYHHVVEDLIEI